MLNKKNLSRYLLLFHSHSFHEGSYASQTDTLHRGFLPTAARVPAPAIVLRPTWIHVIAAGGMSYASCRISGAAGDAACALEGHLFHRHFQDIKTTTYSLNFFQLENNNHHHSSPKTTEVNYGPNTNPCST